jgi:autophagy-related protein 11
MLDSFQVGDLALFLPTRNPNAWAAFNIDAPHYFMAPTERYERYMRYVAR